MSTSAELKRSLDEIYNLPPSLVNVIADFAIERILSIAEDNEDDAWEGFAITTTMQTIRVHIDTDQSCCEDWSIKLVLPPKLKDNDFIGAEVLSLPRWGKDSSKDDGHSYENTVPILISTSMGLVQVVASNYHNGYYPHSVRVSWLNFEDTQQI